MGCLKLHISEHQYKRTELKVSYINKELTLKNSAVKERSYLKARYYDPRTSIWISVDPLAEKYPSHSPYNYCINNPINVIDPDGRDIEFGKNHVAGRDLNEKEKAHLLKGLQLLTDDKLKYNSKTNRVEISERGSGKKKEGTELIRKLIDHDKTLTVDYNVEGKTGLIGGSSGATNGDSHNESNGIGTNVTVTIGIGHNIYTQNFSGGQTSLETLSTGDIFNHELVHAIAQMNGESKEGFKNNTPIFYFDNNGKSQTEMIPREEYYTIFGSRPTSKKMPGYQYPSENSLRREQGKTKRVNYFHTFQIKRK